MVMIAWWGRWGSNWTYGTSALTAILRVHAEVSASGTPVAVVTR